MRGKIQAFIYSLSEGNPQVLGIILISAFFVVLARVIGPFQIGTDQGDQVQAAHRLVQGLGLTTTTYVNSFNFDINQTPKAEYLTTFPPGLSLTVACLLFFKLSLASSLKIIYSLATIIGWIGWAIIGCHFLSKGIRFNSISLPIHLIIAAILPIFYTPRWSQTDIILWSGVPLITLLLFYSSIERKRIILIVISGLIFGLLFSVRYASLFLAGAAFLILFQVNFPNLKKTLKNYFFFLFSSLFIIATIVIYNISNKFLQTYHAGVDKGPSVTEAINRILSNLSNISILFGIPGTQTFLSYLKSNSTINYLFGAVLIVILTLLPLIIIRVKKLDLESFRKDLSISLSFIPISLVIFLAVTTFFSSFNVFGILRYYIPANLTVIFIFYELATQRNTYSEVKLVLYPLFFLLLAVNILSITPPGSIMITGKYELIARDKILGISRSVPNIEYPSNEIVVAQQNLLLAARRLKEENPQALFFFEYDHTFLYDNPSNFRPIPGAEFWKHAYVSEATKIFWILNLNRLPCPGICSWSESIEYLSSLPNLKTVYIDPHDQTKKIMVSDLPKGYKFSDGYQENRE